MGHLGFGCITRFSIPFQDSRANSFNEATFIIVDDPAVRALQRCGVNKTSFRNDAEICLQTIFPPTTTWYFETRDMGTRFEFTGEIQEADPHRLKQWGYTGY